MLHVASATVGVHTAPLIPTHLVQLSTRDLDWPIDLKQLFDVSQNKPPQDVHNASS